MLILILEAYTVYIKKYNLCFRGLEKIKNVYVFKKLNNFSQINLRLFETIIVIQPEMVEEHEPVPEHDGSKLLEHVVLEGHRGRQPARRHGPVGGPGQGVRRPARHAVNLTVL